MKCVENSSILTRFCDFCPTWMSFAGFILFYGKVDSADEVRMWVFEETLASGEKLTDVINRNKVGTTANDHFLCYENP